jgi:hypothetical protein
VRLSDLDAKIRAGLGELGYLPMPMSSAEFSKFIVDEGPQIGLILSHGDGQ